MNDNIDHLVNHFKKANIFKKINHLQVSQLKKYETLYSVREDGFSQRILNYIYTLRIAKKLKKKAVLLWDTKNTSGSARIHGLKEEDSEIYTNIPIIKFNSDFEKFTRLGAKSPLENNIFYYGKIYYFEGENLKNVIMEISELYKSLTLNENLQKIVKNFKVYEYGLHSRSGDISMTKVNIGVPGSWHTKDRLQVEFFFPNEVYKKIINDLMPISVFVSSSSEKFLKDMMKFENVKTLETDLGKNKFNGTEKFILDIWALSKCKKLICSLTTGATLMVIFLRIGSSNQTPVEFLKIEGIYEELTYEIKKQFNELNSPKFMIKKIIYFYLSGFYRFFVNRYLKLFFKKKLNQKNLR